DHARVDDVVIDRQLVPEADMGAGPVVSGCEILRRFGADDRSAEVELQEVGVGAGAIALTAGGHEHMAELIDVEDPPGTPWTSNLTPFTMSTSPECVFVVCRASSVCPTP